MPFNCARKSLTVCRCSEIARFDTLNSYLFCTFLVDYIYTSKCHFRTSFPPNKKLITKRIHEKSDKTSSRIVSAFLFNVSRYPILNHIRQPLIHVPRLNNTFSMYVSVLNSSSLKSCPPSHQRKIHKHKLKKRSFSTTFTTKKCRKDKTAKCMIPSVFAHQKEKKRNET